jgi:hypothetical protein
LHTATLVAVHKPGTPQCEEGAGDALAGLRYVQAGDILASGSKGLSAPGYQALAPAQSRQAANQEFSLSFTTPKTAGQIEVEQQAVHRAGVRT